ncbi:hypothetical protein KC887_03955 [Candidatus Kaiserbacteria bacterium]|nr:hypothetical protein [Candidatus Kaiserbacteria bacterium]
MNKWTIGGAVLTILVVLLAVAVYWPAPPEEVPATPSPVATTTTPVATSSVTVIGHSVEGRDIVSYTFGTGDTHLLFVGGIHGGYEANSINLANGVIEEFQNDTSLVPDNLTIHIIPALNPDGYARALDTTTTYTDPQMRFNANGVDLNRNFDCKWAPTSSWRGATVSAGTSAFSEPEAAALRDYVLAINPAGVVFWHSAAGNVYASECEDGILPNTLTLMSTYALAGNYGQVPKFDAYPVTGDAEGWLASIGIPAVTVELKTHESMEWQQNWAGTLAVLGLYSQDLAR